jgi:anti-sigma factor RsiW
MTCDQARERLLDHRRGRLEPDEEARVAAHLATCVACRRAAEGDAALDDVLARAPRYAAPDALKRRLAERAAGTVAPSSAAAALSPTVAPSPQSLASPSQAVAPPSRPRRARRWLVPLASALAGAALILALVRVAPLPFARPPLAAGDLADEAVNDHLRVVASAHPVEIESGGIHQVKPWFTGRVDFAPRVSFTGDDQFQLQGGSVGYFRDRKAAVFVWKIRLHTITLLVTRAGALPWPEREARTDRGFNVLLWREGELGYALVSDVNRADLEALRARLAE